MCVCVLIWMWMCVSAWEPVEQWPDINILICYKPLWFNQNTKGYYVLLGMGCPLFSGSPCNIVCAAPNLHYIQCICHHVIFRAEEWLGDISKRRGHTQCGQAAVSSSRSRSQDTLLLSVSIYHKAWVKEQPNFLYPSTSHSAELFCRTITNKGNLCAAKTGAPQRK